MGESVEEEVATRIDHRPSAAETEERPGAGGRTPHSSPGGGVAELTIGGQVGRYTLLRRLGAGGMGEVFLAYDGELDRRVAIKVLRADITATDATARLLREAQALARLSHPNVVQVYEVGEASGRIFVAMEYVAGVDLRSWLGREGLIGRPASRAQIDVILGIMSQAGRGLAAAHAAGMAHRDVKPDNIFVGDDGRVRVGDFGLARGGEVGTASGGGAAEEASASSTSSTSSLNAPLTQVGAAPGTPAYMAPEQRLGEFDARSDLFAFSVSLWEAVMGERPFVGRGHDLARRIAAGERRPLPEGQRAPAWLVRALTRGLDPDPARRWPSMDGLLRELEVGPRRRQRAIAVGVIGALAIGGALGVGVDRQRSASARGPRRRDQGDLVKEQRPALRSAMVATKLAYAGATFERAAVWLDRHVDEVASARVAACRGERIERRIDEATRAEIDACLDDRQARLDALVTSLSAGGEGAVRRAISAAANLPAVDVCADPVWRSRWLAAAGSSASEELRRRLVVAGADYSAGRYASAGAIAEAVVAEAEADPARLAAALLLAGKTRYRGATSAARPPTSSGPSSSPARAASIGSRSRRRSTWSSAAASPSSRSPGAPSARGSCPAARPGRGR
ncbi:MAG: serine/threonine protein kinase [Myxococcales bacterium]|nr:serine/threonine protein kinase [Myxococcales bacterium]